MSAAEIMDALESRNVPDADEALDIIIRLPAADQATALERYTRPKWPHLSACRVAYRKAMGR